GEPVVDAPLAPLGRLRVPAPAVALAARRPPCRALGALAPLLRPLGDPPGTRPGLDHAVRPQEQQPEDVLARDLPARARAPERRPGQVGARPVRRFPAALALAPHGLVVAPRPRP